MWNARKTTESSGRVIRYSIDRDGADLSWVEVIDSWQDDAAFRAFFIDLLLAPGFAALRWETPAVTLASAHQSFECVLIDSPDLLGQPDPQAFCEYFATAATSGIAEFTNLGGDARLLAPCPSEPILDFGHLAAFLRLASLNQQHALWQAVGLAVERRLNANPLWLNTAGGGVPWLHLRLDDRPKYYAYEPYRAG